MKSENDKAIQAYVLSTLDAETQRLVTLAGLDLWFGPIGDVVRCTTGSGRLAPACASPIATAQLLEARTLSKSCLRKSLRQPPHSSFAPHPSLGRGLRRWRTT